MTDVAELYCAYRPLLLGIARQKFRVSPEEAEVLLHDVFVAFIERQHLVRNCRSWLIGAICHASRHYWRRQSRSAGSDIIDVPVSHDTFMPSFDEAIDIDQILRRLRARDACALRLRYLDGRSFAEVARGLTVNEQRAQRVVAKALRRARRVAK